VSTLSSLTSRPAALLRVCDKLPFRCIWANTVALGSLPALLTAPDGVRATPCFLFRPAFAIRQVTFTFEDLRPQSHRWQVCSAVGGQMQPFAKGTTAGDG